MFWGAAYGASMCMACVWHLSGTCPAYARVRLTPEKG